VLFFGATGPEEVHRTFATIGGYTLIHFAVFATLGALFTWMVDKVQSTPRQWLIMLLAFWVWALVLFEKGLQKNDWSAFLASGLLAGLAVWTKFTALALVPLLAAYGLTRQRRPGWWLIALVIPLLFTISVVPYTSPASLMAFLKHSTGTAREAQSVGLETSPCTLDLRSRFKQCTWLVSIRKSAVRWKGFGNTVGGSCEEGETDLCIFVQFLQFFCCYRS